MLGRKSKQRAPRCWSTPHPHDPRGSSCPPAPVVPRLPQPTSHMAVGLPGHPGGTPGQNSHCGWTHWILHPRMASPASATGEQGLARMGHWSTARAGTSGRDRWHSPDPMEPTRAQGLAAQAPGWHREGGSGAAPTHHCHQCQQELREVVGDGCGSGERSTEAGLTPSPGRQLKATGSRCARHLWCKREVKPKPQGDRKPQTASASGRCDRVAEAPRRAQQPEGPVWPRAAGAVLASTCARPTA